MSTDRTDLRTSGDASTDWDPATQPKRPDQSLGELFSEMTSEMSTLMRKELELAKLEAKDDAKKIGKGAGMLGGAGLGGWFALLFLSFALAWLLDQAMNTALAFAIVGVLWAIVALVLMSAGKRELRRAEGLPQTKETIKEDVQWAKAQKS
jgi:uncharacterized membrane protein YqjE